MASLVVVNDQISFQEKEREISPAINMRGFSKLVMLLEQIRAGFCQDITNAIAGDFKESFYPAGVQAFMSQGKSYGLPDSAGRNVFWYNKNLCEKAGVDPNEIKYWEDLLDAVKKCKAAGVTPMAVGGSEKWPLHF